MSLFNKRNINLYIGTEIEDGTKPVEIALNGITLINKKEFLDWMRPDVPKTSNRNVAGVEIAEMEEIVDINNEILQNLASKVCSNINEDYGMAAMDLIINDIDEVDILVAVKNDYETLTHGKPKTVANNKIKKIVGFIIVEHGECKSKPNLFCVNLICVKPDSGFNGKLLMGAYLFCIKNSSASYKYGILELANGYTNIGGFISYMKMGFNPDLKLSNSDCFPDYNNLPMTHDIRGMSQQDIVKYATNVAEIIPHDESGVFRVYEHFKTLTSSKKESLKPRLMRLLLLNNLLYKSHVEGGFENLQNEDYKYELKQEERDLFDEMMQINPKYTVTQFQAKITGERDTVLSEILSSRKGGSKKSRKRSRKQQTNTRKHRIKRFIPKI